MPVSRRQWSTGHRLAAQGVDFDSNGRTAEAERAFHAAVAHGNSYGMYNLGLLAERAGRPTEARAWYVRAHRAGHPEAANNLGVLLYNEDDPRALPWWRASAAMGHPQAATNLEKLPAPWPSPLSDPELEPMRLRALAESAYHRFVATDNDANLVRAVTLARKAVRAAADDHPGRPLLLVELRDLLRFRYDLLGRTADLDEAVDVAHAALKAIPADLSSHLGAAQVAVGLLRNQSEVTGRPDLLQSAIALGEKALKDWRGDAGATRGHLESSLCGALVSLAHNTDVPVDLDQAVEWGCAAVGRLPSGDAVAATNLGGALVLRGSPDDLDAAVEVLRAAERNAIADPVQRAQVAMNLMSALAARAELTGRSEDKSAARAAAAEAQSALEATSARNPTVALHKAFTTDGDDAVMVALLAANALPPTHSRRPVLLARLAQELDAVGRTDEAVDVAKLAAATAVGRSAVVDTHRVLGRVLYKADDDTAVDAFTTAARACDETELVYAEVHVGLAGALIKRFLRDSVEADRDAALEAVKEAARAKHSPLPERLFATQVWTGVSREAGRPADALEGACAAVSLLWDIGWSRADQSDRERGLKEGAAMPREAAALAIEQEQPELAVELLEQGRAVMWRSTLHLRGDLDALAERDPGLAADLQAVRSALTGADPETRTRLARRWTELLARARELPGFEGFLAPEPFAELARAADEGPVVIVNISTIRCDALVLRPGRRVEVVPLPGLDAPETDRVSNTYMLHLAAASRPGASDAAREQARHTVHDTLEWLWEHIAKPVLAHLELPTESGAPPRVWWCPTASLVPLPLHAAGCYPRTPDDPTKPVGLPFAVVSSYTTTLASLIEARKREAPTTAVPLAVGLAESPRGHAPLKWVTRELHLLRLLLGDDGLTVLEDEDATVDAVRHHLPRHSWAHFSCHGRLDMTNPSTSGLCLWDDDLTVTYFSGLHLDRADLAFLSACHTRLGGAGLPDEAVHTAAALRMAGFRHTVATLWSVYDKAAHDVTKAFYERVRKPTGLTSADAATALHEAVADLRAKHITKPIVWAPFVHDGP